MIRTCLEEGCSTDLIQEGQRALSRHQESSSTKGVVAVRPRRKQQKRKGTSHKERLQPSQKLAQEKNREQKAHPSSKREGISRSKEGSLEKGGGVTLDGKKKGPPAPLCPSLKEFHSNNSYSALSGDEEKSSEEEEDSLEDQEDSLSSESSLDQEEEDELEEEAARYEEERYGHRRLLKTGSSGGMVAPCTPSAPPPYPGVDRSHFIKGKNQENPHWVPSRLTYVVLDLRGRDEPEAQDDGCLDPDGDPDATMAQQTMPHGEDGTLGSDQSLAGADATSC
ncbi:hypothetical protein STEG23_020229 [Scotinomys teguina]